mmetsp:Transcript_37147/g.79217  ORF Transcript_37147/g.79217 Transcript_37147/m.79217 type:complete len:344 (+) Transcript_37147:319-1350(+)
MRSTVLRAVLGVFAVVFGLVVEPREEGDRLHGLPESHLVRQDAVHVHPPLPPLPVRLALPEPRPIQQRHPVHPQQLILGKLRVGHDLPHRLVGDPGVVLNYFATSAPSQTERAVPLPQYHSLDVVAPFQSAAPPAHDAYDPGAQRVGLGQHLRGGLLLLVHLVRFRLVVLLPPVVRVGILERFHVVLVHGGILRRGGLLDLLQRGGGTVLAPLGLVLFLLLETFALPPSLLTLQACPHGRLDGHRLVVIHVVVGAEGLSGRVGQVVREGDRRGTPRPAAPVLAVRLRVVQNPPLLGIAHACSFRQVLFVIILHLFLLLELLLRRREVLGFLCFPPLRRLRPLL